MPNLSDYSPQTLGDLFSSWGYPRSHALKLLRQFYQSAGTSIDGPQIARGLFSRIQSELLTPNCQVVYQQTSSDGAVKSLLEIAPASPQNPAPRIECVLMPSHRPDRAAGCVSSQAGCAMGCDFCASTRAGVIRNLTSGEIVEQFLHLRKLAQSQGRRLLTLVFMGMGEPLLNYDNVIAAIRNIASPEVGSLGWRQITLSTVGIVPAIHRLADDNLNIHLAISLHAPDDATRASIVPTGKRYTVTDILAAADDYQSRVGRIVNIEYCLLDGVNDSTEQAHLLAHLLGPRRMHVNLIPYNHIGPGISGKIYQHPPADRMNQFAAILRDSRIVTHFRQPRGQDIAGACGQLAAENPPATSGLIQLSH